jgi:PKD repeat protein
MSLRLLSLLLLFACTAAGALPCFQSPSILAERIVDRYEPIEFQLCHNSSLVYVWSFGDSVQQRTSEKTVTHEYTAAGAYRVDVSVQSDEGDISLAHVMVYVRDCADAPSSLNFIGAQQVGVPLTMVYCGANVDASLLYAWQFGDLTASEPEPGAVVVAHMYHTSGDYDVSVADVVAEAVSIGQCTVGSIQVQRLDDARMFRMSVRACADASSQFVWSFGDGRQSDEGNNVVTHEYASVGRYTVLVEVHSDGSVIEQSQIVSAVGGDACDEQAIETHGNAVVGSPLVFYLCAPTDGDQVQWNFDDGIETLRAPGGGDEAAPTHVFHAPGFYDVEALLFDAETGARTGTYRRPIQVDERDACAIESLRVDPPSGAVDELVGMSLCDDGESATVQWTFGDGASSSSGGGASTSHRYGSGGVFQVQALVGGAHLYASSVAIAECAHDAAPIEYADPTFTFCGNADAQQGDELVEGALTYEWSFGDGAASAANNPFAVLAHRYDAAGTYQVSVIVRRGQSQVASAQRQVATDSTTGECLSVEPAPLAQVDELVTLHLCASGADGATQFRWHFGDGEPVVRNAAPSVEHRFAAPGLYACQVDVGDSARQFQRRVAVLSCDNGADDNIVVLNTQGTRVQLAICASSSTYRWQFGDGAQTSASPDNVVVEHTYVDAGTYNVNVTYGNATLSMQLKVADEPKSSKSSKSGLDAAQIVGIVFSVIAGVLIACGVVYLIVRRRRLRARDRQSNHASGNDYALMVNEDD